MMSERIILVCDQCETNGDEAVPAVAVPVMVGGRVGILDVCKETHLPALSWLADLIVSDARPPDEDMMEMLRRSAGVRPESAQQQAVDSVECAVCGSMLDLRSRAKHAAQVHGVDLCQIRFLGAHLVYPSRVEGCQFESPSAQGMSAHLRRWHP